MNMAAGTQPMPVALQAERALLGGIMVDPDRLDEVGPLPADDFYRPDHAALWQLFASMRSDGVEIDTVSVFERVSAEPELYGELGYVVALPEAVPSTTNLPHYAALIAETANRRRMIVSMQAGLDQLYSGESSTQQVAEEVIRASTPEAGNAAVSLQDAADELEAWMCDDDRMVMSWPWESFNRALGCAHPGDCIVIAMPSGTGKTTLVGELMNHVGITCGEGVYFWQGEMDRKAYVRRTVVSLSESLTMDTVKQHIDRHRPMTADEWKDWDAAKARIGDTIRIDDQGGLKMSQIRPRLIREKRLLAKRGVRLQLAVLDNLQIIEGEDAAGQVERLGRVALAGKNLAKDEGIVVVIIAQLNPDTGELYGAKTVVRANVDGLMYGTREVDAEGNRSDVIVISNEKGRNAKDGQKMELLFDGARQRVTDLPAELQSLRSVTPVASADPYSGTPAHALTEVDRIVATATTIEEARRRAGQVPGLTSSAAKECVRAWAEKNGDPLDALGPAELGEVIRVLNTATSAEDAEAKARRIPALSMAEARAVVAQWRETHEPNPTVFFEDF